MTEEEAKQVNWLKAQEKFECEMIASNATYLEEKYSAARMIAIEAIALFNKIQSDRVMNTSFQTMSWACGHSGGAACVKCFEALNEKYKELKWRMEGLEK